MTPANTPFSVDITPDWEGFLRCLRREDTPDRVHFIELLIDEEVKATLAQRYALMDDVKPDDPHYFLCRADEAAVHRRTRATLETCHPGGGYCLGTGNSVPNYMPLENYLATLDEGRRFG